MTIQVELPLEDELRLHERAAATGASPEALAREMLRSLLHEPSHELGRLLPVVDETGTFRQERWEAVMASIARGSANAPVLPSEALTREAMYGDPD